MKPTEQQLENRKSCNACNHYSVCKIIDIAKRDSVFHIAFILPENLAKICRSYDIIKKEN